MQFTDIFILNIGAGSCAVIGHPSGRRTMVDINNGRELRAVERELLLAEGATTRLAALEAELVNPIEWYRDRFGGDLWRFILSHPDDDHMAGLRCILQREEFGTTVFWDLPHSKPIGEPKDYKTPEAYIDRALYELMRADQPYKNLNWPQVLLPERFDSRRYWDEDAIEILSPDHTEVAHWNRNEKWNDMSFVLRFHYGGRAVILPGDVEQAGWDALDNSCRNIRANVLVASHHGRKSGFPGNGVIDRIAPDAVIVSSGKMPAEHDATQQYSSATSGHVFSTRFDGTIMIRIWDDGELAIARENGTLLHQLPPLRGTTAAA